MTVQREAGMQKMAAGSSLRFAKRSRHAKSMKSPQIQMHYSAREFRPVKFGGRIPSGCVEIPVGWLVGACVSRGPI